MIGIHQSFESNIASIPITALSLDATTFQIFIRNNRNMKRRAISKYEIDAFNVNLLQSGISTFVVHASYAMNPCTDSVEQRDRLIKVIRDDLIVMNQMAGIKYYVLHPGSSKDCDILTALNNLRNVLHLVEDVIGTVHIALEFMAGAGTQVLCTPEQIEYIMAMCYAIPNLCICFDTCHVFAAGYNVPKAYTRLRKYIGVLHLNNSKETFGSHKDRHAPLQSGLIPTWDLEEVCRDFTTMFPERPVILETPGATLFDDLKYALCNFQEAV